MNKKKIAIFLNNFDIGGAEVMVYELLKKIDYSKFELFVVCIHGKSSSSLQDKVNVLNVNVIYLENINRVNFKNIKRINKLLNEINPDVVHTNMGSLFLCMGWCKKNKKKHVTTLHTIPSNLFNYIKKIILRVFIKTNKLKIVTVSKENYRITCNFFGTEKNIFSINNGVDIDLFNSKVHDYFTFINVGRQDENKNQIMIVKVFRQLLSLTNDSIKLILVGDGPEHIKIKQYVRENNLEDNVVLTGFVTNPQDYLSISDVYIQSSKREGLPLSIIEAMATGLPVLSTDVGGIRDLVVNGDTGYIYSNENDLFEKMSFLYKNCNILKSMEKNCKEKINEFSSLKMAKKYEEIYTS